MRIIYDNSDFDNAELVESSEDAAYPVENVQHIHSSKVWRTLTGSITAQTITLDAGVGNTYTVSCIALLNHNLTSGATIKFQMNATDSWGSPSIDETITWRSGMILKFFTESSYRFARFYFDDGSNTDNYIQVGRIFMNTYLQISPSSKNNFKINNVRNDQTDYALSGEPYSDVGIGYRTFRYDFPRSDFSMIESLRTVWDTVGKFKPFIFLNFDTRYTEIEPAYVMFLRDFEETHTGFNKIEYSLQMREVT